MFSQSMNTTTIADQFDEPKSDIFFAVQFLIMLIWFLLMPQLFLLCSRKYYASACLLVCLNENSNCILMGNTFTADRRYFAFKVLSDTQIDITVMCTKTHVRWGAMAPNWPEKPWLSYYMGPRGTKAA
uniref:Uncharacterized protein n=1 Tax=Romanomermis culicivorax TaxID=13658 RepID=A0A915L399_ROMCU